MDELEISGKRYISTKRAAREHGYHSDYMGQLIRGKKVAGQKVGRAWYIDEESLNAYLGKAPMLAPVRIVIPAAVEEPVPAPVAVEVPVAEAVSVVPAPAVESEDVSAQESAPVEFAIAEEPAPVDVSAPQPRIEAVPQEPEIREPEAPVEQEIPEEELLSDTQKTGEQPVVRAIYHAPYIEEREDRGEREIRIPIRTPMPAAQEKGGLRYMADDSAPVPAAARQDDAPSYAQQHASAQPAPSRFPLASLCVVAVFALLAAVFASNFISATVVSEEGKPATVNYAIHW